MKTSNPAILIDTNRWALAGTDEMTGTSTLRYAVAEPTPCACCGSKPGRFAYACKYDSIRRVGASRLGWIDAKGFCSIGCWRVHTD